MCTCLIEAKGGAIGIELMWKIYSVMRVLVFNESRNIGLVKSPGAEQIIDYFQETLA